MTSRKCSWLSTTPSSTNFVLKLVFLTAPNDKAYKSSLFASSVTRTACQTVALSGFAAVPAWVVVLACACSGVWVRVCVCPSTIVCAWAWVCPSISPEASVWAEAGVCSADWRWACAFLSVLARLIASNAVASCSTLLLPWTRKLESSLNWISAWPSCTRNDVLASIFKSTSTLDFSPSPCTFNRYNWLCSVCSSNTVNCLISKGISGLIGRKRLPCRCNSSCNLRAGLWARFHLMSYNTSSYLVLLARLCSSSGKFKSCINFWETANCLTSPIELKTAPLWEEPWCFMLATLSPGTFKRNSASPTCHWIALSNNTSAAIFPAESRAKSRCLTCSWSKLPRQKGICKRSLAVPLPWISKAIGAWPSSWLSATW